MKQLSLFSLAFIFLLFSCGTPTAEEAEQAQLWDEVMAIHDEVMPSMSSINRINRNLKNWVKDNEPVEPSTLEQISAIMAQLNNADEGMMSWMADIKKPSSMRDEKSHDEIILYLNTQKLKIMDVKTKMTESIAKGEALQETLKIEK